MPKDATDVIYRACFNTNTGKKALSNMLLEARFFDHIHTPEEQAVQNFMKTVLCKMGCYDANISNEYVEKLLTIRTGEKK